MAGKPLLFKGDKILVAASFLQFLKEKPDFYSNCIVTLEGAIDSPDGKTLVFHHELKEKPIGTSTT